MRYLWDNSCMVKRFCQWLYEEWSENFIFVCQEEMVKGTYVRFEYKLRFMREVMVRREPEDIPVAGRSGDEVPANCF